MQWTILSSPSDLRSAVLNGPRGQYAGFPYSIPYQQQGNFTIIFSYGQPGGCIGHYSLSGSESWCELSLLRQASNSTTSTEDYVVFSFTVNPNGPPVQESYTGPNGTLAMSWDSTCTSNGCTYYPVTVATISPSLIYPGTESRYFSTTTNGNYTLHLTTLPCQTGSTCSTTSSTGFVNMVVSSIAYSRPYYNTGLATVTVGAVSAAGAVGFLGVTANRFFNERRRMRPPSLVSPPPPATD